MEDMKMKKDDPALAELLWGLVCGDEILACDRHSRVVQAIIEKLKAGSKSENLDEDLSACYDTLSRCPACKFIATGSTKLFDPPIDVQGGPNKGPVVRPKLKPVFSLQPRWCYLGKGSDEAAEIMTPEEEKEGE